MKLFKVEHKEEGTWYFTTKAKAARYIGTSPVYFEYCLQTKKTCKEWKVEEIESGDILSRYINPEK